MKYHCSLTIKSLQFDKISASHVSWPLVDINALHYDDIYGFHYFLQHSIDFEIYSTYMNCPSNLCHYSCLYNRWRHAQWFRIKCNLPSSCLRAEEVKVLFFSLLKFNCLKILILKFYWRIDAMATYYQSFSFLATKYSKLYNGHTKIRKTLWKMLQMYESKAFI